MADTYNLEQAMRNAALNATAARRVGNHDDAEFWTREAERLSDQIVWFQKRSEWDILADGRHG